MPELRYMAKNFAQPPPEKQVSKMKQNAGENVVETG